MGMVETLTIDGTWEEKAGDPEKVIRSMFTLMTKQNISTVFIESRKPDTLDVISVPDPYDLFKSKDEFKKSMKIARRCLQEAGYTIIDDTEAERMGRELGTSAGESEKKKGFFRKWFSN
ncbi:hypothetical protein [[Clostridium] aminophilum]|uniref:Uncharacterized protein n=1 Tax=[Clostridium] aminophilum TaxID=1526 RepID=A0A1I6IQP8_9FIRM|nr:hypothetical protein [[Clostridium] aminophilum]SFR69075.1 hypothetical protein SAMN02910262_00642 [[Clostridium] aminophilum]